MKMILPFLISALPLAASAWDGVERRTGNYVEIGRNQLVREGENIEYYNLDTAEDHEAEVTNIEESNGTTNVSIIDNESDEPTVLEME